MDSKRRRGFGLRAWAAGLAVVAAALAVLVAPGLARADEPSYVAAVGEARFETFDAAVAAARDGDTIALLADCSASKGLSVTDKTLTVSGRGVSPEPVLTFEGFGMYLESSTVTFADCTVDMSDLMDNPTSSGGAANLIHSSTLTFSNADLTLTMDPAAGGKHGIYLYGDHSELSVVNGSVANISGFNQGEVSGIYADNSEHPEAIFKINVAGGSELNVSDCAWNGMTINPTDFTIDGGSSVTITDCGGDGTGKGGLGCYYGKTSVTNGSTLSVNDNGGKSWGIFTKDFEVDGTSKVEAKGNYGDGLTIGGKGTIADGAQVTLTDNGGSGLWVYASAGYWTSHVTVAAGADVTITGNEASGIYNRGTLVMNAGQVTNNSATNGGGINAVNGSSTVIGGGVVLCNNHATTAGDDVYASSEATIALAAVASGQVLDGDPDCTHAIDGWYDDAAAARWNAHPADDEELHVVLTEPAADLSGVALKAAHGLITVDYQWVGTAPSEAELPAADTGLLYGATYTAKITNEVEGYTFDGWYTDQACTSAWVDGTELSGNMTLYGRWIKDALVTLSGTKVLKGAELSEGQFSFALAEKQADGSFKTIATASNGADGSFSFDGLAYAEPGEHTYRVTEVKGNDANVTYSDEAYTVQVSVSLGENNAHEASVTVTNAAGEKVDAMVFENVYSDPASPSVPATGDNTNAALPVVLLVGGSAVAAGSLALRRRNQER